MLFWLFVIILVVGVALMIVGNKLYNTKWDLINNREYYSKCKGKEKFFYKHCTEVENVGAWMLGISGVVLAIMVLILCCTHINVDAFVAENKERYTALEYKVTSGACRDELGLLSKEVIDEVQDWNEDLVYYQNVQDNFWIGIFYPDVFDQFETIDYEKYNTGD